MNRESKTKLLSFLLPWIPTKYFCINMNTFYFLSKKKEEKCNSRPLLKSMDIFTTNKVHYVYLMFNINP